MANAVTRKNPKGIKDSAISLGVVSAAGVGLYFLLGRKKEEPLPETPPPPPPPPTQIPEIDAIFAEMDAAIAKLEEITKFLREQAGAAQEILNSNTTLINDAKQALAEAKDKLQKKTLTQSDAEKLLEVLGKVIAQIEANNQALISIITAIQKSIDELQSTINTLKNDIAQLKYQLEPVPVTVSVSVSGTHASAGSKAAPVTLSYTQVISVRGYVDAKGSYPFGCTGADVILRNISGATLKHWHTDACCHLVTCDKNRTKSFQESIQLPLGLYTIQASVSGTGGGGSAATTVEYKTARFLVESQKSQSIQSQTTQSTQPGSLADWIKKLFG